jgi:hypothetical protein
LTDRNEQHAVVRFTGKALSAFMDCVAHHKEWRYPQANGRLSPAPISAYRWRLRSMPAMSYRGLYFMWGLGFAPPAITPRQAMTHKQNPELYAAGKAATELFAQGKVRTELDLLDDDDAPF